MFTRTFGIEIEAYGLTQNQVATALRNAGINAEVQGYNHTTQSCWKVITDGSIQGVNGFELVSPVLQGEVGLEEVRTAMTALKAAGAKVNKTCGFHVHFGANDMNLQNFKNLFKNWVRNEDIFDAMLPNSRRDSNNSYCKSLLNRFSGETRTQRINKAFEAIDSANTIEDIYYAVTGRDRYFKLNLLSFWRHGTVEVRHHSGTVEADKVCNWVLFMGTWMEQAIATNPKKQTERAFSPRREWATEFEYRFGYRLFYKLNQPALTRFYRDRIIQLGGGEYFPRQVAQAA
jgi:hypothetical protein